MSAAIGSRKLLHFALLGAAGCLAGWLVGEGFLWAAKPGSTGSAPALSLVTTPVTPDAPPPLSPPPPPPPELAERLKAAGAKTGDVQISLGWKNINDLDLHCIDPNDEEISFRNKKARSGGELDVDMNATEPRTRTPVENIYWPAGGAPLGQYRVYVDHYANHGDPDPTEYLVSVLVGRERRQFTGTISKGDRKKLIWEFEVRPPTPVLRLAVPSEVVILAKGSNDVPVRIARDYFEGTVLLRLGGDLRGLTVEEVIAPANRDEAGLKVTADADAPEGKRDVLVRGVGGGAQADVALSLRVEKPPPSIPAFSWWLVLVLGLWTALLTVGLSLALVGGQNRYLGRPWLSGDQARVVAPGALAAGLVAGGLGQALLGLFTLLGLPPGIGFLLGWLLLGALVGRGVCFFIPNLNTWRATLAGAAGALLGAVVFLGVSWLAGDVAARLAGAALLGSAVGLMVALVEMAFRKAWLEIAYTPREISAVNLGPEPVSLGGDRRSCTILAQGAAPIAFRYWFRDGQVMCEDVIAGTSAPVLPGHTRSVGKVSVTVRTAADAEEATPPGPPMPLQRATAAEMMHARSPSTPAAPMSMGRPAVESTPFRPSAPPVAPPAPTPDPRAAERAPFRPSSPSAPASPPPPAQPAASERCPRCGVKALGKPGQRVAGIWR